MCLASLLCPHNSAAQPPSVVSLVASPLSFETTINWMVAIHCVNHKINTDTILAQFLT